jgi:pimeloyl-ACP methyl ester carboxylesterase
MNATAYQPVHPSSSTFVDLRGLRHHVRMWGDPADRPLVLLHGSRDMSASWQFVVDQFRKSYFVIAPDWRGHGLSDRNPQGYWFQDYLGDLDALLDHFLPGQPVDVIGHSLGGNVASIYAGVRPERIGHLVALDAFGLMEQPVEQTADHLRAWLDGWRDFKGTGRPYASHAEMAGRLLQANPRLTPDKAAFLAPHMARETAGGFVWSFDALHRLPFALRHRRAEWAACVARATAPTLWVASDRPARSETEPGGLAARKALVQDLAYVKVLDTSHNVHHDKPQRIAQLIEDFLDGKRPDHEETT